MLLRGILDLAFRTWGRLAASQGCAITDSATRPASHPDSSQASSLLTVARTVQTSDAAEDKGADFRMVR